MAEKVSLLLPLVLRLQRRPVVDAAQEFQMVAEFMVQDAAQNLPGFLRGRLRISPVEGSLVQDDLADAGIKPVLPQDADVIPPRVVRGGRRFRDDDAAGELPEEFLRELIQ